MTRATRRPSAARLTIQLAMVATLGSAISGGCSSGVKTVNGDCPTGGTGALAGGDALNGGANSGAAGMGGMAGEAGQGQGGAADGGEGGGAAASSHGGESGDPSGNAGSGGTSSGGMSHTGGHGGTAGHSASAGNGAGGQTTAKCGDKVTTPPEFCDDGTNTDLSYGCYACTTLPPPAGGASQGGAGAVPEQCDQCLQADTKPTSCYRCVDYRACYACLRRQPDDPHISPASIHCGGDARDDEDQFFTHKSYSDRCFDPNNSEYQSATGGPAGSEPRGLVCQALVACILRTGCAVGKNVHGSARSIFADCYCGVVPTGGSCIDPTFVPNGPCVNELRDADAPGPNTIGPALASDIGTHIPDPSPAGSDDHWSALGVASQIAACAADPLGCADVCFPNSSSTGGTAGTTGVAGSSGHGGS